MRPQTRQRRPTLNHAAATRAVRIPTGISMACAQRADNARCRKENSPQSNTRQTVKAKVKCVRSSVSGCSPAQLISQQFGKTVSPDCRRSLQRIVMRCVSKWLRGHSAFNPRRYLDELLRHPLQQILVAAPRSWLKRRASARPSGDAATEFRAAREFWHPRRQTFRGEALRIAAIRWVSNSPAHCEKP